MFEIVQSRGTRLLRKLALSYAAPTIDHQIIARGGGTNDGAYTIPHLKARSGKDAFFLTRNYTNLGDDCASIVQVQIRR